MKSREFAVDDVLGWTNLEHHRSRDETRRPSGR